MRHLPEPPGRHRPPAPGRRRLAEETGRPGSHRGDVKPRYGRIAIAFSAMTVTAVAVLGNFGLLMPEGAPQLAVANADQGTEQPATPDAGAGTSADDSTGNATVDLPEVERPARERSERKRDRNADRKEAEVEAPDTERPVVGGVPLPESSGTGRRVVFSESLQRVWLVAGDGEVLRSYPVSGSAYDNLDPGTYEVYSMSRNAVGIDDSGTMEFFVRFTQGDAGGAIGFHTIPIDDGEPVQTKKQLGIPLSHGCIRQAKADAIALWEFAPVGTTVVVTI